MSTINVCHDWTTIEALLAEAARKESAYEEAHAAYQKACAIHRGGVSAYDRALLAREESSSAAEEAMLAHEEALSTDEEARLIYEEVYLPLLRALARAGALDGAVGYTGMGEPWCTVERLNVDQTLEVVTMNGWQGPGHTPLQEEWHYGEAYFGLPGTKCSGVEALVELARDWLARTAAEH